MRNAAKLPRWRGWWPSEHHVAEAFQRFAGLLIFDIRFVEMALLELPAGLHTCRFVCIPAAD